MGVSSVHNSGPAAYTKQPDEGGCGKKPEKGDKDDGTITKEEFSKLPPEMQEKYQQGEDGKYKMISDMI